MATTGRKVYLIPLTVSSSYASLHMTELVVTNPLTYSCYVIALLATLGGQLIWYRMTTNVCVSARAVQRHYITMNWARRESRYWRFLYRDLPKHGGTFETLNDWRPHVFGKKITVATMKIHYYIRRNWSQNKLSIPSTSLFTVLYCGVLYECNALGNAIMVDSKVQILVFVSWGYECAVAVFHSLHFKVRTFIEI